MHRPFDILRRFHRARTYYTVPLFDHDPGDSYDMRPSDVIVVNFKLWPTAVIVFQLNGAYIM